MTHYFCRRALFGCIAGWALFAAPGNVALAQGVGPSGCVEAPGYPCNIPAPYQAPTRSYAEISAAERGDKHYDNDEWAAAIEAYEEALRYCTFDCDYLHRNIALANRVRANREGNHWHRQKSFDLAIAAYQRALAFCQADMDCQYIHDNIASSRRAGINQRGNHYYDAHNWGAAIAEYQTALDTCRYGDDCDYIRRNITLTRYSRAMEKAERADTHAAEIAAYEEALNYCHVTDGCAWVMDQIRLSNEAHDLANARRETSTRLSAARELTYSDRPADTAVYFDGLLRAENEIGRAISATRAEWGETYNVLVGDEYRDMFFEKCCRSAIRQEILSLVEALGELWHRYRHAPAREALDRIMRNWGGIDELGPHGSLISAGAFLGELQDIEERNRVAWNKEMIGDLRGEGRSDIAIERLRAMLEDNPGDYDLWRQLAKLEKEQGDWIAVAETRRIIVEFSRSSTALNNLGVAYHHLGQYEEAAAAYEQALEINPDYLYALGNMASSIVSHDPYRLDEAAELYARALARKPAPDDQEFYDEIKQRAAELEQMRGGIEQVRKVVWPVVNSNTAHSIYRVLGTVRGAVSEGLDAALGNEDPAANLDQARLASHYGGLAVEATNEISPRWHEFYLTDRAGEAPHFLASQVFDRGQSGNTQIGGLDEVPDIEGGPVGGETATRVPVSAHVMAALRNEPEWLDMAVQEQALEADLALHAARLETLESRAKSLVDTTLLEEISAEIDEVQRDIDNAREEREQVAKKMASFAIDFSERLPASGAETGDSTEEAKRPAEGDREDDN